MRSFLLFLSVILLICCITKEKKIENIKNVHMFNQRIENKTSNNIVVTNYELALNRSKLENKKIFLLFTTDWCHACKLLKKTLDSQEVRDILSKYIVYEVNADREKDLVRKYQVSSIPKYFIIDHTEKIYKFGLGYMDTQKFVQFLQNDRVLKEYPIKFPRM